DRTGHEETIPASQRAYQYPGLSPDGTKIAVNAIDEENDIWVYDTVKNTETRMTSGPAVELLPTWMPDGRHFVFDSAPRGSNERSILRTSIDGTVAHATVLKSGNGGLQMSISHDGKWLIYQAYAGRTGLFLTALDGTVPPRPLVAHPTFRERNGAISPDDKALAYESNESGPYEIFVRPFPNVDGGRWQVSNGGGQEPMWSAPGGGGVF